MAEKNAIKTPFKITDHLPLRLIPSEIIPPAPNRPESQSGSEPAIDWIPDFAGYAWIAYGASSLLVISHLPNPLSETEPGIGPIFRQVLELSADGTGTVSAVSWSPATPSSGDLAATLDNCIGLFSYNPHTSNSSFCWSQTAILEQSTKVDAIKWTGSGDGIISGGVEVVLWRKKDMMWEIAWKFKPELPQILVSTSWTIEGHSATAPPSKLHSEDSSSSTNETSKCVLVCHPVGDSKYIQAELRHPMPVSMIQWRPSTGKRSKKDAGHRLRLVLLTCCLDGAIRLWSEVDDGRIRKAGKDNTDHKATRLSFRVVAVIEVNQALRGVLGSDIFVRWASEIDAIVTIAKETKHYSCSDDYLHDKASRCEWLIGYGREGKVTLWAIHCLDDFAPLRFPRVTLWKAQELPSSEVGTSRLLLDKAFIMRNRPSAPPKICSFVELLPCNSLSWLIHSQTSTIMREGHPNICQTQSLSSSSVKEILDTHSHTGKILQVAVHPYLCEAAFAASLDSDGTFLLWSVSSFSYSIMGMPTLNPSWKLSRKSNSSHSHSKYTSLRWAPAVLNEDSVLVMGHAGGIDCFVIKNVKKEEEAFTHYNLCAIPFGSRGHGQAPTGVWTIPLPATCDKTFVSNNFMLVAVWKDEFHALSWKISIHHCDSPGSCCACGFEVRNAVENNWYTFEGDYSDRRYYISVVPFSSMLPAPHNHDEVSSFAILCPTNFTFSEELKMSSADEFYSNCPAYHMVTGCADGSLKLWKSIPAEFSSSNSQWDLVGILAAHGGPVLTVSPSVCGRKIATVASADLSNTSCILNIWECVNLAVAGGFILEDKLYFNGEIVALNWLVMGNGRFLLGVCLQNELHVYTQRHSCGLGTLTTERPLEGSTWVCIAVSRTCSTILDFFWGPKAMPIVVHHEYFCLFSHLAFLGNGKHFPRNGSPLNNNVGSEKYTSPAVFSHPGICHFKDSSMKDDGRQYVSRPFMKMNVKDDILSIMNVESSNKKYNSRSNKCLWSLTEVAEQLGGSLPVFHPEALLINTCSGNWRRAYVALQHLAERLASNECCYEKSSPFIPSLAISKYFDGTPPSYMSEKSFQWSEEASLISASSSLQQESPQYSSSWGNSASNIASTSSRKSETSDFIDALEKLFEAAAVTLTEKMQIRAIIDLLQEISSQQISSAYGSLDEPGRRFWVSVRFQRLYFVQRCGRPPMVGELVVHSALIGWAFHSDCQENLFDSLLSNEPSWEEMRDIGVGYWYANAAQLRMKMEKLARRQFLKSKDPKACALLYIALNRLQVLAGLFKISKDDKDKPLVGFLSRNFQDEKNKAAALKNAYVLMGKHQLELAVAFFLLGGDTTSAVTVCAKNLGDAQLALVICRLVEGYGGPLEHHLVSKFLLPSALANDDCWLASLLEWIIGNHSQAFLRMLGLEVQSMSNKSVLSSSHASFLDPSIGQYCLMLATKTSMKNAIGEQSAAVLGRWAILMTATALSRCGLPLEALECLSSSLSIFGGLTQRSVKEIAGSLNDILKLLSCTNPSNWISGDVALNIESQAKSDLAVQYMSTLLQEHPNWLDPDIVPFGSRTCTDSKNEDLRKSLAKFQDRLTEALACFQQKFSLIPLELIQKVVICSFNYGLHSVGYNILHYYASENLPSEKSDGSGCFFLYPVSPRLIVKATEEVACMVSRYVLVCSINCSYMKSWMANSLVGEGGSSCAVTWEFYRWSMLWSLQFLRVTLKMFSGSRATDFLKIPFNILDLFEYYVFFAAAWSERNLRVLLLLVRPLLTCVKENAPAETDLGCLSEILCEVAEMLARDLSMDDAGSSILNEQMEHKRGGDISCSIDERWQLMAASLWGYVSTLLKRQLNSLIEKPEGGGSFQVSCKLSSMSTSDMSDKESHIGLISGITGKLLDATFEHISFYCAKQFVSYLLWKSDVRVDSVLLCLKNSRSIPRGEQNKYFTQRVESIDVLDDQMQLSDSETLWNICANPKIIAGGLVRDNSELLQFIKEKSSKRWIDMYANIMGECEADGISDKEDRHGSPIKGGGSPLACLSPNDHPFLDSGAKDTNEMKKVAPFLSPKEVYKSNGELFEALCINSINQHEAALASNRKGLVFFKCGDGLLSGDDSEYIWLDADWPRDGWAGSESTPIPTCVSPGVGLGSKKGTHLGLGGATVGAGSLVRPGRDLIGSGRFGFPGYAGVSASNLGWGVQEEFDDSVDPPATLGNVRTRALSAHPSRPLFLVGSSNTHIYLWEFGKDRATATYGVLPAANVPPPYALASISAVRFDRCGHRFVTGALDGTVCTWQIEVGGRSNIRPTESSVCFNNHTSDVSYVTASGSIIAAAGYSSNGVNVVVWDTLAPPATSRASIMCHEGGARSLAVFDNNIGSGSISPLIVTGGRDGDVGLHDFRYIATGRTKRHKHPDGGEQNSQASSLVDMRHKTGDQNRNGMLWYIPKAHSGSVTKISTIPNTSFFLTGSKDGDVKLWDAKQARLVFHWPRLHERHTFLQPSSRGFGGVVRAAITDIQVVSSGFLTCGGDGSVKMVELKDF